MTRSLSAATVAAVALAIGAAAPVGASGVAGGEGGTSATPGASAGLDPSSIAVRELTGADGEALIGEPLFVNERGQVAGAVAEPGYLGRTAAVWHRGTVTRVPPEGVTALASAISERGEVVGERVEYGSWLPRPFSWLRGEWSQFVPDRSPILGLALGVNARGQVLVTVDDGESAGTLAWQDGAVIDAPAEVYGGLFARRADINERGQAVVHVSDGNRVAAVWRVGGGVTRLGTLGGATSLGNAINERGDVAGTSETASGQEHAFRWRDGEMVDLGTLGGAWSMAGSPGREVSPDVVNERGHVAGTSETASGAQHAFLWRDGEMVDLGTLGGAGSVGVAVNDRGQVIGRSQTASGEWHAFVWQGGRMVDLGALAGDAPSEPTDINDRGQVVGWVEDVPEGRAVMWTVPPHRP